SDSYHEEFASELAHIISPPEYDHFYFKIESELGNFTMDVIMAASAIAISFDSSDKKTSTIAHVISSAALVVETTLVVHPLDYVAWFPIRVPILIHQRRCLHQSTFPRYQLFHHSYAPILLRLLILLIDHHRRTLMLLLLLVGGAGTHLNEPLKLLTVRKRVGPLPARRLASRHSSGLDASDQVHSGSSTRDVSPRLCYPQRRAPRRSEAFRRWCAASLSTLYPPTTSESSSGDSSKRPLHSSSHSVGPSCKRCRSPVDSVPSFTPVMGSLAPTHADLLPPRKRFRDSYLSEASIEEDTEI
ncbi:hypothetical protein Tco_0021359, partial [Tanacetum coccineum]